MSRSRRIQQWGLGGIALVAIALATPRTPVLAQGITRLAFGYECGNTFIVHNDGAEPVDIQYAVSGSDRAPLHLNGGESVSITSSSSAPVELWANGKLAATEPKGNRPCASTADLVVRELSATAAQTVTTEPPPDQIVGYGLSDGYEYYPQYPYAPYYPYYVFPPYDYGYVEGGPIVIIRGGVVFRRGVGGRVPIGGRGGVIGRGGRGGGR